MKYALISEAGVLHHCSAADCTSALRQVGPEGWNTVYLGGGLAGFVNDCGLVLPDAYGRNPVGGLILIMLGAQRIPYAGPVVITGWDPRATYRDEPEVIGLTPVQTAMIGCLHRLATDPDPMVLDGDEYREILGLKHMISSGSVPPVTFGTVPR